MHYQMWHVETRNLMDDFDDEAEALDAARAYRRMRMASWSTFY